jgi:probable rRNA maturation factor
MIRIHILPQVRAVTAFSAAELRRMVGCILQSLDWKAGDLEILVTSDREVAQKNRDLLGLPGPTNVLSFPLDMDPRTGLNGSIVLSAHALYRESDLYAQEPAEYWLRMLAHAVLHLGGYEHGPEMEEMTGLCIARALEETRGK